MHVLLIHTENKVRDIASFALESSFGVTVKPVAGFSEAMKVMLDDEMIDLIIAEDASQTVTFMKYLASVNSDIPIVLVEDSSAIAPRFSPFPELKLLAYVRSVNLVSDLTAMMRQYFSNKSDLVLGLEKDFCRIHPHLLLNAIPLEADIYLRLSAVKYVKLFAKGETFERIDLENYFKEKEIKYLYLKLRDCEKLVAKFKDVLSEAVREKELPADKATDTSISIHEIIHQLSLRLGVTPELQTLAKENVIFTVKNVLKNRTLAQILKKLTEHKDRYLSVHSIVMANFSCVVATKVSWTSETTFQKLCYASMFHDITLTNDLAKIRTLDELELKRFYFRNEEVEKIKNHPIEAADLISKFYEIPPDVDQIIRQHHERPDSKGFPRGLAPTFVSPLSALFIVAHDVVDRKLQRGKDFDFKDFLKETHDYYNVGKFRQAYEAVRMFDKE